MRRTELTVATHRHAAGATGLVGIALLFVATFMLVASPAGAQDSGSEPPGQGPVVWELRTADMDLNADAVGRQGPASRFYNQHLMPRMNRSFETYGGVWLTRDAPGAVHQDVVYDVWSRAAEKQAERATRRALADYVLEETSLSRAFSRLTRSSRVFGSPELTEGRRRAGTVRWDAGISHGLPKVDMLYSVGARGQAEVKFSLAAFGRFRVDFRPGQLTRTRLRATWLFVENEYRVGANFAF
jgi:hypothetical protein